MVVILGSDSGSTPLDALLTSLKVWTFGAVGLGFGDEAKAPFFLAEAVNLANAFSFALGVSGGDCFLGDCFLDFFLGLGTKSSSDSSSSSSSSDSSTSSS